MNRNQTLKGTRVRLDKGRGSTGPIRMTKGRGTVDRTSSSDLVN